ncbi:hypothetical protein H4Q26_012398 [Puccinia striiformis f. sp. tritici PST-130]|nr:hypothetical protein H4Q26_012398 [Puccinia striiformis f. sp. tritici PST-130]
MFLKLRFKDYDGFTLRVQYMTLKSATPDSRASLLCLAIAHHFLREHRLYRKPYTLPYAVFPDPNSL